LKIFVSEAAVLPSLVLAAPLDFPLRGKSSSFAYAQDEALSGNEGAALGVGFRSPAYGGVHARSSLLRAAQIKPRQSAV
jgi:hypothetical protein